MLYTTRECMSCSSSTSTDLYGASCFRRIGAELWAVICELCWTSAFDSYQEEQSCRGRQSVGAARGDGSGWWQSGAALKTCTGIESVWCSSRRPRLHPESHLLSPAEWLWTSPWWPAPAWSTSTPPEDNLKHKTALIYRALLSILVSSNIKKMWWKSMYES